MLARHSTVSITLCVTGRFYIKKSRQLAKNKTICVMFLYTKRCTLCVTRFFMEFLKLAEGGAFLYSKKQCTLRYIFIYKKQFTLRYVLTYKNPYTLRYAVFHGIFEIGGGRGIFIFKKTMHFALHFYIQKSIHFALRFNI